MRYNLTLYKVMMRKIVIYACETWATTKTDDQNLSRFEKKGVTTYFWPQKKPKHGSI
jgi:hypothetical protein